jgi:hypothetical protein
VLLYSFTKFIKVFREYCGAGSEHAACYGRAMTRESLKAALCLGSAFVLRKPEADLP